MENNTAKNFALQLGSLASLYLSLSFLLVLIFGIINILFPDAVDSYWELEQASSSIRIGIAMTIVFFPAYIILTRKVNQQRRKEDRPNKYLDLTKWLIYLSLLASGAALLGSLVTTIVFFLEGDITIRFMLKVAAILVILGMAFWYYLNDAKGYWLTRERQSIIIASVTSLIVASAVVFGFISIPNPNEVREMRLDSQMLSDLQDMQWRLSDYYQSNKSLPADLAELYGVFDAPTAPESRPAYEYLVTSDQTYSLCATFANEATEDRDYYYSVDGQNHNWEHKAGRWCFERGISSESVTK